MPVKTMPKLWPVGKPWRDITFVYELPLPGSIDWKSLPPVRLPDMEVGDRLVVDNAAVMAGLRKIANGRRGQVYEYWSDPDWKLHTSYLIRVA